MNKIELKFQLEKLGIFNGFYSLDGELLPDRVVLFQSYNEWDVFYFDERGNRERRMSFSSESDACKYIYESFKRK